MEAHTPPLFALAHYEHSFPTAVQALSLLHQLLASHQATSDRFYRALYAALLAPALPASSKASMMLALVFKSLKEDVSVRRAAAFVKRLLQVCPPLHKKSSRYRQRPTDAFSVDPVRTASVDVDDDSADV